MSIQISKRNRRRCEFVWAMIGIFLRVISSVGW